MPKSWGQADGDLQVFGFFQNAFIHQTEYTATPPFNGESARNSFSVQQHNLFFRKDLDRNWRAFVNHKGFNSFSSSRRWGSLNLEEAWVRYCANSNLNEINNRTPCCPISSGLWCTTPLGAARGGVDVANRCVQRLQDALALRQVNQSMSILARSLDNGQVAMGRITAIVESLRNFARLDAPEFQRADVHEGIDSTLTLMHAEFLGRITVQREFGEVPEIYCYPGQLNQTEGTITINSEPKSASPRNTLQFQQALLAPQSSTITYQLAIGTDDAVTGHDDG